MRARIILTAIFVFAAGAIIFLLPARAVAWDIATHRLAAKIVFDYLPDSMKGAVKKYRSDYEKGVDTEPELYDAFVQKNGQYDPKLFSQFGLTRMMYHLQKIQSFLDKKTSANVLSFTAGQYVHCVTDLLEPLPAGNDFSPLEITGSRMFFIADFAAAYTKFDFLFDGKTVLKSLPASIDALMKQNSADAAVIYKAYYSDRNFKAVDSEASRDFNRALNFIVDSLTTIESLVRNAHGQLLNLHAILGLDRFSKTGGGEMQIKGPNAPNKPTAPTPPKKDAKKK